MRFGVWLLCAVTAVAATPLRSQEIQGNAPKIRGRLELATASGYLWRGITRHRYPVAQVFGSASRRGTIELDLSAWASGVTGSCRQPLCTEGSGLRLADVNGSLLASVVWKNTRLALGANAYHFHSAPFDSTGASGSTWEAIASLFAVPSRHIQLAFTGWMDFDDVDGLYLEATGTMPVSLYKAKPPRLFITAATGLSYGQNRRDHGKPVPGYFTKNGFTHVSLEVAYLLLRPDDQQGTGISLQTFIRVQGNLDEATRAPVWPFKRRGSHQQVIGGLALYPLAASGAGSRVP